MARGSVRRQVRIKRPADEVWAIVGDPAARAGVVHRNRQQHRRRLDASRHHRQRTSDARGDRHQRSDPTPFPVPHHVGNVQRAPQHDRRDRPRGRRQSRGVRRRCRPGNDGADHRRRRRQRAASNCAIGWRSRRRHADVPPQDPARHHRPAALRHARLQRRDARPHASRRHARRARHSLRARSSAVGCVHAVARTCSPGSTRRRMASG